MKSTLRKVTMAALALAGLALNSCMENSNVVTVRKDGSGEITARYYFSPQMAGMMGMMGQMTPSPDGTPAPAEPAPDAAPAENPLKPTREKLEEGAASFGEGVTYASHEYNKNRAGWDGYVVVYSFEDINKLKLDPNKPSGPLGDMAEMSPDAAADASAEAEAEGQPVTFSMADGVLTIETGVSRESIEQLKEAGGGGEGETVGPDGQPMSDEMAMQMAAQMFQGFRIGMYVRIEGEIAETNAKFVTGDHITLSDLEMGKLLSNPEFAKLTKESEQLPEDDAEAALKFMDKMNEIDGMKVETQEKVTVKFK